MSSLTTVLGAKDNDKEIASIALTKQNGDATDSSDLDSRSQDSAQDVDGDYGSYQDHIFNDPEVEKYWSNVYEKATYEGRHRFDPSFTWSAKEERRLRRKVSRRRSCSCL